MDRRKKKTQRAIRKALLELLEEKNIESISILDIADQADINRGTFYLHYVDKYDMLDKFEQELLEMIHNILFQHINHSTNPLQFIKSRYPAIVQLFNCLKEERDLFLIVLKTNGLMSMQSKLIQIVSSIFRDHNLNQHKLKNSKLQPQMFIPILVSLILGWAQFWSNMDEEYSSELLAREILNIMLNGPAKAAGLLEGELIDIDQFLNEE